MKCYRWHCKRARLQQELAALAGTPHSWHRHSSLSYRVRVADRVLAEYAWREAQLQDEDVDPVAVLALLYAVAGECRSEVAPSVEAELALQ